MESSQKCTKHCFPLGRLWKWVPTKRERLQRYSTCLHSARFFPDRRSELFQVKKKPYSMSTLTGHKRNQTTSSDVNLPLRIINMPCTLTLINPYPRAMGWYGGKQVRWNVRVMNWVETDLMIIRDHLVDECLQLLLLPLFLLWARS